MNFFQTCLREAIKSEDEGIPTENILKRKCFGYICFLNVADKVNIICFIEGSLKWYREYFNRDWVFFNTTGFRHPFTGHPPLPVAEYTTSEHSND